MARARRSWLVFMGFPVSGEVGLSGELGLILIYKQNESLND
jgi:hypothetical protein